MSSTNITEDRNDQSRIGLTLPIQDGSLFKHSASGQILNFLSDNPEINVSIRQLASVTGVSERATRDAVDVLAVNDLIETFHEGNARRVQINREQLTRPADPINRIPQPTFRMPVRVAYQYLTTQLTDIRGIVLFGSTATGTADRQSDIDLWTLVGSDHMQQRHEANKVAKRLSEIPIPQTIPITEPETGGFESHWEELKDRLESGDCSGDRYSFDIIVETPQSIISQSSRVDPEQLFAGGITLLSTEVLEQIKMEVISNE